MKYRRNINLPQPIQDRPPSIFEMIFKKQGLRGAQEKLRRKLKQDLLYMPSKLLKMNRAIARTLFSPDWDWDVDFGICEDDNDKYHAHVLAIYPFKEEVRKPELDDFLIDAMIDDIASATKIVITDALQLPTDITDVHISEDEEDGRLALAVEMRIPPVKLKALLATVV